MLDAFGAKDMNSNRCVQSQKSGQLLRDTKPENGFSGNAFFVKWPTVASRAYLMANDFDFQSFRLNMSDKVSHSSRHVQVHAYTSRRIRASADLADNSAIEALCGGGFVTLCVAVYALSYSLGQPDTGAGQEAGQEI